LLLRPMTINREIIIEKIKDLLDNRVSQDKVYEWILAIMVTEEYESAVQNDQLLKDSAQALIDINHEGAKNIPTREDLKYLKDCLEGKTIYESLESRNTKKALRRKKAVHRKYRRDFFITLKIYVVLFALCSIAVNLYGIFNPEFLIIGMTSPTRLDAIGNALPHLIYASFLLFPLKLLARSKWYYGSVIVMTVGAAYYWYIAAKIAIQLSSNFLMVVVVSPFSGVPASLAVVLIIEVRKQLKKVNSNNKT